MKNLFVNNLANLPMIKNTVAVRSLTKPFILLCLVLLGGCAGGTFPDKEFNVEAKNDYKPYLLGPGDKIRVSVYEHEDLSGNFTVDDTGRISLPLIRGLSVTGLSLPKLEEVITTKLAENYIIKPKVSVDLTELRPFCISGEVKNPGCYNYVHGLNASKAIALAGGYSYRALKNKLAIIRANGDKVVGNNTTPVFSGDSIEVFERYF